MLIANHLSSTSNYVLPGITIVLGYLGVQLLFCGVFGDVENGVRVISNPHNLVAVSVASFDLPVARGQFLDAKKPAVDPTSDRI